MMTSKISNSNCRPLNESEKYLHSRSTKCDVFELIVLVEQFHFFASRAASRFLGKVRDTRMLRSQWWQNPASNSGSLTSSFFHLLLRPFTFSVGPESGYNTLITPARKRNKASQRMPRNIFIVVLITRRASVEILFKLSTTHD